MARQMSRKNWIRKVQYDRSTRNIAKYLAKEQENVGSIQSGERADSTDSSVGMAGSTPDVVEEKSGLSSDLGVDIPASG